MRLWNRGQEKATVFGTLVIFVLLISSVPTLLPQPFDPEGSFWEDEVGINSLKGSINRIKVPRLITESASDSKSILVENLPEDRSLLPLAIGQQTGPGGGSFSVYDSFNWTGEEMMNTSNSYVSGKPTSNSDSLTVTNSTGYNRQYGVFDINDVEAEYNKTNIEDTTNYNFAFQWDSQNILAGGDGYFEVAMSFQIKTAFAYIKKVRMYVAGVASATGKIYITNATGGNVPNDVNITSKEDLGSTGEAWHEYTFDAPVLLQSGQTYFVVMNETNADDDSDFWRWFYIYDSAASGDGVDEGIVCYKEATHSTWNTFANRDLPLQLEILPVEWNGTSYNAKIYTNPAELDFSYESSEGITKLNTFNGFSWNDSTWHKFSTNTSVSFNLSFVTNYTYALSPVSASSSYLVSNSSIVAWNLTFSTAKVNTTYNIRNHSIGISGIKTDWNGTNIYWNDSAVPEFSSLSDNTNVTWDGDPAHKYSFGNTTMVVNASTLAENATWHVWFEAPNYLLSFNLSRGVADLQFPYQANVTDVIDLKFEVPESGGNISYWIEYYGLPIYKNLDFDSINPTIIDSWDINNTVPQTTNVNGTYDLQGFWMSEDETKVGTSTRNLDVFINTTLTINSSDNLDVVIGEKITLWANYTSNHNSTPGTLSHIRNARIWANASWPQGSKQNFSMNQPSGQYYNSSFTTDGEVPGSTGTITITTQFSWFVNWTTVVTIRFVGNSNLTMNATNLLLEWRENATLRVDYNDTSGAPIGGGMITVDGNNANEINNVYYYRLNTTDYAGEGIYSNLVINATHPNYVSREIVFDLIITPGETSITGRSGGQTLTNITGGVSKSYANSSADNLSVNLRYYYILADDTLNTLAPSIVSPIPYNVPVKESNLTWTIVFNPNKTGSFLINVTFGLTNYNSSTFVFNLTVTKANTTIYSEIGTSAATYYNESLDFFLLYNNTEYNENITGLSEGAGITLNNTKVGFLNRTGDYYWFRIGPTTIPLGIHSTNITFAHIYFESSFIVVSFEVLPRPTDLTGQSGSQPLVNDTTVVTQYFANSSADSVVINLEYYDQFTSNILDTSSPLILAFIPITGTVKESNLSWTLTFNPNQTGSFLINISFNLANYKDALFIFHLTVFKAQTVIHSGLPSDPTVYHSEHLDFFLLYNNTNYNENITGLTLGSGITLNNSYIDFLNRTGDHYWFRLNPNSQAVGSYATNVTFSHIYFESSFIVVSFEVLPRPTDLTGQSGSQPLVNDTTVVTQYFANSSADSVV
ncbi:MAG: hypothetical protein ACFFFG_10825, partial [Candidatus Thorarchaeota archaeon]